MKVTTHIQLLGKPIVLSFHNKEKDMLKITAKNIRAILPLPLLLTVSITSGWATVAEATAVTDYSSMAIASNRLGAVDAEQVSGLPAANLDQELQRSPNSDSDDAASPEKQTFAPQQPQPFMSARAARNEKTRECRVSGLCS